MRGPAGAVAWLRERLLGLSHPVRLGISLVLLSLSVLFFADLLGLRPDARESVREARKTVAESLAVQLSSLASVDDVGAIEYAVSAFVLRSADVSAAALVRANGVALARHGDREALEGVRDGSTETHLRVPILKDELPWGELRIVFEGDDTGRRELLWYAFVAFASLGSFALFLAKVLVQLDPGRAVPGRVDSAFDLFSAGVVILDDRLRIVMANEAASAIAGRAEEALTGRRLDEWPWQVEPGETLPWVATLESGQNASDERLRLADGDGTRALSVSCALVGEDERGLQGVLVTLDDETLVERQNAELASANARLETMNARLDRLATTDPLTGISNRRVLMERLEEALPRARADGTALACVMADVDHFKRVNDTFGHGVGDEVIRAVSEALAGECGPGDTLGRYGGEEFVLVLPGCDAGAAAAVAERVRLAVSGLAEGDRLPLPALSASFGVADLACEPADGSALIDAADRALYAAKQGGRDRVVVFGTSVGLVTAEAVPDEGSAAPDGEASGSDEREGGADATARVDAEERGARARVFELEALMRRRERDLAALRQRDALTGVPVREPFLERTALELERAARSGCLVGAISFELRDLERIVSSFGHAATDDLVREFVARVEGNLRATDLVSGIGASHAVSRVASNEYGVLLGELDAAAGALVVVARLRRVLAEPFAVAGQKVWLGANIGIALSGSTGVAPDASAAAAELLAQAGDARAKAAGGSDKVSHAFASRELDAEARDYIRLEADLREALDAGTLDVWYQPKLDLATRSVTGLEALLRWRHPTRGFVSPETFVAVAEANGLIGRLSEFVLRATLERIRVWRQMGFDELQVSINVSPMQLQARTLAADTLAALERAGVPGAQLEIELTETSVFERPEEAREALEALRAAGVGISMDDFGTGYTSLALLADLPLDTVKLDRSFIVAMEDGERNRAVVASVITMARALGLRTVGEGVETEAQLELLAGLGCDAAQGYLISRPLPGDEISAFLVRERDALHARSA